MITRRSFLIATSAAVGMTSFSGLSFGETHSKTIDRRNASSNIEYRLIFTARVSDNVAGFPGHAYMMVGEYDNVEKVCRFDKKKIFGYYPKTVNEKVASLFAWPLPGEVRADYQQDLNEKLITHRLEIQVAQNGYDAAAKAAEAFQKAEPYVLGDTDCVKLVETMLAAVESATNGADAKLVVPNKATFQTPGSYLTKLLDANGTLQ